MATIDPSARRPYHGTWLMTAFQRGCVYPTEFYTYIKVVDGEVTACAPCELAGEFPELVGRFEEVCAPEKPPEMQP